MSYCADGLSDMKANSIQDTANAAQSETHLRGGRLQATVTFRAFRCRKPRFAEYESPQHLVACIQYPWRNILAGESEGAAMSPLALRALHERAVKEIQLVDKLKR